MSPLVSETATTRPSPAIISAETAHIKSAHALMGDMSPANDAAELARRPILERRRKRWNRRLAR